MNKLIIGFAALVLFVAGTVSAATFSHVTFSNNQNVITGQGGTTVDATFRIVVPVNQVIERIETVVVGSSLVPACHNIQEEAGLEEGTHSVTLPIKLPANTGTHTLEVRGAGIFGGNRSVSCLDNVVGSASFSGAIRVVATPQPSPILGSPATDVFVALQAKMNELIAAMTKFIEGKIEPTPTPSPSPIVNPLCKMYRDAKAGTHYGVKSSANARFQGFLLSQSASIPALEAGSAFGWYLNQTMTADGWFLSVHSNCQ